MNVYKFSKDRNTYQIIVSSSLGDAAKLCTIDYIKVTIVYKNVVVDRNTL